jgi:hypothetical protein
VRKILPAIFALAVLLPAAAFARAEYLCRLDGRVRSSCCCPIKAQKAQQREVPGSASVRRASCCTVSQGALAGAQTAEASKPEPRPHASWSAVAPVPAFAPLRIAAAAAPRPPQTAPPDPARELFARNCALLL